LFLKDQPYENKTDMGHLVLKLLSVVIAVKDVNLFIITDGTQPIVGLRFDNEIKAACESRMKEARRAKKPFIICLAARGGDIHSWSLTLPGEQVQLPDRRATVPKPKVVVASVTTSNEVPRAVVPSIMMTSSRPRPGVITEQKQPVRANVSEVAPLEPSPIGETTADESSPVANRANATTQSRTIGTPELTVRRDAALAAAAVAEAEILRRVSRQQSAQQLAKASNAPTQPTQPAKAPLPAAAEEMIVAAREPGIVPGAVIPGATRLAAPLLSGKELLIAGIILLLIATGLVFILFRWSNPVTHGSYITRSMDR
jgi:hypothetical protein